MTEEYIGNLSKWFPKKTAENGRNVFVFHQNYLLKSKVHWVKELETIRREPTPDGIEDNPVFKESIDVEKVWAAIINHNDDDSYGLRKEKKPGNTTYQKECIAWS